MSRINTNRSYGSNTKAPPPADSNQSSQVNYPADGWRSSTMSANLQLIELSCIKTMQGVTELSQSKSNGYRTSIGHCYQTWFFTLLSRTEPSQAEQYTAGLICCNCAEKNNVKIQYPNQKNTVRVGSRNYSVKSDGRNHCRYWSADSPYTWTLLKPGWNRACCLRAVSAEN